MYDYDHDEYIIIILQNHQTKSKITLEKWAKGTKIWDLNARSRKKRKRLHHRHDTEEMAFDVSDVRLMRALSSGKVPSNLEDLDGFIQERTRVKKVNMNRKATVKYDQPPITKLHVAGITIIHSDISFMFLLIMTDLL